VTRALTVAAYAILGSLLAWSRFAGLDDGYCCDEIATVVNSVRAGPGTILTGAYTPNNHELYSLLGWATSSTVGESEIALRLGAAIPFVVGVAVVTAWLHVRVGALAGILFLFFATASPLLLDISRLARGYGLAFLAMSVLTVAALEALRDGRSIAIVAFWAAGVLGTFTLPNFAVAFATTGAVLFLEPRLRLRCAVGAAASLVAVAAWYAPHLDDIAISSLQSYGLLIPGRWLLTSPFDQILTPALTSLDETLVHPNAVLLIPALALAVVIGSSPLLRRTDTALILTAGVVATLVAFWLTETRVVPRFFSFLLVPLFVLVATGSAAILGRLRTRPAVVRTVIVFGLLGMVAFTSLPLLAEVPRTPRDALREAAAVIREQAPEAPVYAYMPYSADLAFHLGRPVNRVRRPADAPAVCQARSTVAYLTQPWLLPDAEIPSCTSRAGVRHYRFRQYARGRETNVWIIPARAG
jgi:hypothetical protein